MNSSLFFVALNIISRLALTAWVGGLWMIGYLAVPILFYVQPDRQLAGLLAGQMFSTLSYLGIVCGVYLLLHRGLEIGKAALRKSSTLLILTMLAITLSIQFGIQPWMSELKVQALPLDVMQSQYASSFKLWHGVSSILYLIESLMGAVLVVLSYKPRK